MSRYEIFDRTKIELRPIAERGHDILAAQVLDLTYRNVGAPSEELLRVVDAIKVAQSTQRPVILMMGAHPIKLGLSRFLIDLIQRGIVTLIATNGAGVIHDFELACWGGTSENVAKWIRLGQFGLWQETDLLNQVIRQASERDEGLGEGVGRFLDELQPPHRDISIAAAAYRCGVPLTCHVTIGGDIIHAMDHCDGAALGQTTYTDFLIFARAIQDLEGGVFLNIGSAVTGPEVYLKALSMARNVARQKAQQLCRFTTAVFDLMDLPTNWGEGPPSKLEHGYYYRPWKTILTRTVADGGQSFYIRGDHTATIPTLWQLLVGEP